MTGNEVRGDGGCLYCAADQGETHRPGCTKPAPSPISPTPQAVEAALAGGALHEADIQEAYRRFPDKPGECTMSQNSYFGNIRYAFVSGIRHARTTTDRLEEKPARYDEIEDLITDILKSFQRMDGADVVGMDLSDFDKIATAYRSLSARNKELVEGLRPFAAQMKGRETWTSLPDEYGIGGSALTLGDLRRARSLTE